MEKYFLKKNLDTKLVEVKKYVFVGGQSYARVKIKGREFYGLHHEFPANSLTRYAGLADKGLTEGSLVSSL